MLKILCVILGIFVVVGRSAGLISPKLARRVASTIHSRRAARTAVSIFFIIFAGLGVWASLTSTAKLTVIFLILSAYVGAAGLTFLLSEKACRYLLSLVERITDKTLRALCALGVLIGLGLIYLGLFVY